METVVFRLQAFLRDGKNWESRGATVLGVSLVKIPGGAGITVGDEPCRSFSTDREEEKTCIERVCRFGGF